MNDPALSLPEQAGELKSRRDAMCRFGVDRSVLLEIHAPVILEPIEVEPGAWPSAELRNLSDPVNATVRCCPSVAA